MKFLSIETLGKHKFKTPEGYLICTDAIIARTGKQQYRKNELFEDSAEDDSVIDVDRPANEVFSDATIASFENKSLVDEHPDEDVNIENHKDLSKGYVRDVHKGIDNGQEVLMANIVVTDPDVIAEIESGDKTELSCGYDCKIMKDNKGNYYQSNIRGNHVALCEQGRAGNARIQDSINDSYKVGKDSQGRWYVDEPDGYRHYFTTEKEARDYAKRFRDSVKDGISLKELENDLDDLSCVAFCYTQGDKIIIDSSWKSTQRQTEKDRMELMQYLNKKVGKENYDLRYEKLQWRDNNSQCSIRFTLTLKNQAKDSEIEDEEIKLTSGQLNTLRRYCVRFEINFKEACKAVEKTYKKHKHMNWDTDDALNDVLDEMVSEGNLDEYKEPFYDAYWGPNDNVLSKEDAIKELKTAKIKNGDYWDAGDPKQGYYIQVQAHGMNQHEEITKYPRVSPKEYSYAWGRIWKDGKYLKEFNAALNVVRQDMIRYLQSIHDSLDNKLIKPQDSINELIEEEYEAVNSYEEAIEETDKPRNKEVYNHIKGEEEEHIRELEELKHGESIQDDEIEEDTVKDGKFKYFKIPAGTKINFNNMSWYGQNLPLIEGEKLYTFKKDMIFYKRTEMEDYVKSELDKKYNAHPKTFWGVSRWSDLDKYKVFEDSLKDKDNIKIGSNVSIKVVKGKPIGIIKKIRGDVAEVEYTASSGIVRLDQYYLSDLELKDSVKDEIGTTRAYEMYLQRLKRFENDKEALEYDLKDLMKTKSIPKDELEDLINKYKQKISKLEDSIHDSKVECYVINSGTSQRICAKYRVQLTMIDFDYKKKAYNVYLSGSKDSITNALRDLDESGLLLEYPRGWENIFDSIQDVNPRTGESKEEFIKRFMSETKSEYPDEKQRFAVANSYWERKNKDSIKDGHWDDYFGEEEFNKYGPKVYRALKGKVISKRMSEADEPGGISYEAEKLGMTTRDMLRCLEGMCFNDMAKEISDHQYKIKDSKSKQHKINKILDVFNIFKKIKDEEKRYVVYAEGTWNNYRALFYKKKGGAQYTTESNADKFTEEEANKILTYKGKYTWKKKEV